MRLNKGVSYPVASHSYFRIANKTTERQRFLAGLIDEPKFIYTKKYNKDIVERRVGEARTESARKALELVSASIVLQGAKDDQETLRLFREFNQRMYGVPSMLYLRLILGRAHRKLRPKHELLWQEVLSRLGSEVEIDTVEEFPSRDTFLHYKRLLEQYRPLAQDATSLEDALRNELTASGLSGDGWKVSMATDASHAKVVHNAKSIIVGKYYRPRTKIGIEKIVVHEVYGHAKRGLQSTVAESEGFAVLLEQLVAERFMFARSYRYLAAALGWGVDGVPRTFREVYDIIWRLMVIMGRYNEVNAKTHAFDECARVYRGGRADVPGAVYLKDTVYFTANLRAWQMLEQELLTYNQFVDSIEGRRKVLG